jgi:hypothetical protein
MNLLSRIGPLRALVVTAAALLAVAAGTPATASAAPAGPAPAAADVVAAAAPSTPAYAPSGCGSGNLCFWNNINYNDGPGQLSGSNASWFNFAHSSCPGGTWADCVSSIFNNGVNCTAHVYYYTNYAGPKLNISRGTGYSDLTRLSTGVGTTWNDNIESNNWC